MSYKTGRGNVAKKSLRFHALVKIPSDYQLVTKHPVATSRQLALEVRFAHPVRLSPDTHSQGHGRPCLHDPATARACLAEGIPENGVSIKTSWLMWPGVSVKTFSTRVVIVLRPVVSGKRFITHGRVRENSKIGEKTE